MKVTPPWFSNNLVLLLYKIFYCSLLLGVGKKPQNSKYFDSVFFIWNPFCLLTTTPAPVCKTLRAQEAVHVYTGSIWQTWASPVFWVDQLWSRRLLTASKSRAALCYWSCTTSCSAGLPLANLECKQNKLRYVCAAQCMQIHSHWEWELHGI